MIDRDTMLSDAQIDEIFNAMPGGPYGFLKSWGFRQFARAVTQKAAEAEREACANLAESELCSCCWSDDQIIAGEQVAAAIRARGTAGL